MRKIKEILRLKYDKKLSSRLIGQACRVARSTVQNYIRRFEGSTLNWPLPESLTEEELENQLYPKHESEKTNSRSPLDLPYLISELARPNVTKEVLWSEYKQADPDGFSYSRFCQLVRGYQKRLTFSLRQEHVAGEKVFLDFGKGLHLINAETGEKIVTQLFVATWGASNYTFAQAVLHQDIPSWIDINIKAFNYFGGCPKITVPDNLKAAVSTPCYYEPEAHPSFVEFAQHYGTVIMPARPRKPKDKAKVEVAVKLAKRWILARLRNRIFTSLADMNEAIKELLELFNRKLMKKLGKSRLELFESLDKPHALPLPDQSFEFANWKPVQAGPDYHVEYDQHYYSVPYTAIRQPLEVRATAAMIEILLKGQRLCSHTRSFQAHGYTTVRDHMPLAHQKYLEWTPERIIAQAKKSGHAVQQLVEHIFSRSKCPPKALRTCLGIVRLTKHYADHRLNAACQRALDYRIFTFQGLKNILKKNLDQVVDEPTDTASRSHENVRGADYYTSTEGKVTIH